MRSKTLLSVVVCGLVSASMLVPAVAGRGKGKGGGGTPQPAPVLTQQETEDLQFMREEEKLARDVYIVLYDAWGLRVFDNIAQSEQRHADAVLRLIVKYGLPDPVKPGIGEFTNQDLQDLYDDLIAKGLNSKLDALEVGVDIEVTDIADIEECMEHTDRTDILRVYGNLLDGSLNHLDAFLRNVDAVTAAP